MHSILGRGLGSAFSEEQEWKEPGRSHHATSGDPLFAPPSSSGSLQDILRSVHMVEGSGFPIVPKSSGSQPEIVQAEAGGHNIEAPAPEDTSGNIPTNISRKQLECHSASSWDHGMRPPHVFEQYPHVGLVDISAPLQLDSGGFKTLGTWSSSQAGADQQWTDLRKTSKNLLSSDVDDGSCQPSSWRERWSESPGVAAALENQTKSVAVTQLEESTDGSDPMDEKMSRRYSGVAGYCSSRNLFSERKRRKKMNDGLYSLRSLVPNISKMDKASIIGDAIKYVVELERQVKELESELEGDEQRHSQVNASLEQPDSSSMPAYVRHQNGDTTIDTNHNRSRNLDAKNTPNVTLELSRMKTGLYNLRMFYQQQPGMFMHMTQAIERLELEVLNSHVAACDGYVVHSLIAKKRDGKKTVNLEIRVFHSQLRSSEAADRETWIHESDELSQV